MRASTILGATAGAALLTYVAAGGLAPLASNDVWIHLTTGRLILEEGEVPRTDRYSFTAEGSRYVAHEWLAAALYAAGERLGGTTGVIAVGKLAPSLLLAGTLLAGLRAAGARTAVALPLAVLALTLARHRMIARPELLALVLASASVAILYRDRRALHEGARRRGVLWLVPIAALWANVHGSFPLGIALALLFALAEVADRVLGRRDRVAAGARAAGVVAALCVAGWLATLDPAAFGRPAALAVAGAAVLVAVDGVLPIFADPAPRAPPPARRLLTVPGVAAAMALAAAANPRGPEIYLFPFEFTAGMNPVTENIEEWKPLLGATLLQPSLAYPVYLALLALFAAALARALLRGRLGRLEGMLLLAFGVLPLRHARWMAMFAVVTLPALAATLQAGSRGAAPRDPLRAAEPARARLLRAALALAPAALGAAAFAFGVRALAVSDPDPALRATAAAAAACGALAFAAAAVRAFERASLVGTGALAAGLAALAVAHGIPEMPGHPRRPVLGVRASEPLRPVAFLRRHGFEGRLFTEYEWAGFAIHELWPDVRVFIDSRSEVYGPQLLLLYREIKLSRAAARRALEHFDVDLVLARYEPYPGTVLTNPGVLGVVESDPRWKLLYADDGALLYARRDAREALPPAFERLRPRRLRPGDPSNADPALEAEARRAIELAPHSAFLHFALATSLRAQGRRDEARAALARAFELNPHYPGAPQLAGELAVEAGDTEAARRWFRRAQRAYPDWPAPAQALAKLGS